MRPLGPSLIAASMEQCQPVVDCITAIGNLAPLLKLPSSFKGSKKWQMSIMFKTAEQVLFCFQI